MAISKWPYERAQWIGKRSSSSRSLASFGFAYEVCKYMFEEESKFHYTKKLTLSNDSTTVAVQISGLAWRS